MKIRVYSNTNLENLYFSRSCNILMDGKRIVISKIDGSGSLTITGNDFLLKQIYFNLQNGVKKNVLQNLLSCINKTELFDKLIGGYYIE